jgi:hexosaminidase
LPNTLTRTLVFGLIVLGITTVAHAQSRPINIQIIPQPRELTATGQVFPLRGAHIVLADSRSQEDRFAAEDFINDLKEAGIDLKVRGGRDRKAILIGIASLPVMQKALRAEKVQVPANLNEEGYVLHANPNGVIVTGASAAGVFYGLQTLKQLVRGEARDAFIQCVGIVDWPGMRWRGVSDDISRGPVPTVAYIKRQLRTFAAYKLNLHSFYMEHAFSSNAHPLIGPEGGSLTPAEIRELVAYAKSYHIEIVPEQQTFGHLHKALKLEKYNPLAETPYGDVLSPHQEGTYKLIADWYRELEALFPSQFFHIGADETFELGQGQSREAARERGVGAVYFEHLNRVRELLKPYNRKLIFWGDIALNHPNLINSIPKDLIVANWDYSPRDHYGPRIDPFKNAGLQQFVCPGVWGWNQIFPNIDTSSKNIIRFVADGHAADALGMLNTTWDDDGETLFEMSWYGIVLGAAASWQSGIVDQRKFDEAFDWTFFRADGGQFVSAIRTLGSVNTMLDIRTSNDLFWRNPFTSPFQNDARANAAKIRQMRLQVETVLESLLRNRERARRNATMIPALILAAQRFDHLGRRAQTVEKLSREYWEAYLNLGDRVRVRRLRRYASAIYNQLREMAEELSVLRASYREQWLAENRPYWLDSVLARYDHAIAEWLEKSRELGEVLRNYETTSTLPNPEAFGLGPRIQP